MNRCDLRFPRRACHDAGLATGKANMKIAEQVTFGGSALDRAAELRTDKAALAAMKADPDTRVLPVWRGKPLTCNAGEGMLTLGTVTPDAEILRHADRAEFVFLGRSEDAPWFAADVSKWEPEGQEAVDPTRFLDPTAQHPPGFSDDHLFRELRSVMTALSPRDAELAATAKAVLGWHTTHLFCARCGHASDMAQGGWQRVCPACGAHHFPRTDPVVIMLITDGNDTLIGRSPGWPEGMFSLLAGFVEPGETLEAAVRREVFEETGVRVGQVDYLASQPWPFPASLMVAMVGQATSRAITLDPKELDDALWISREELADVFAGQHPSIKGARPGAIAHFILENWLADRLD